MKISKLFWRLILFNVAMVLAFSIGAGAYLYYLYNTLPQLITVQDYDPLLSSDIYARDGQKIGELYSSKQGVRFLTLYKDMPKPLIDAFLAAEDDSFFTHTGFNLQAILRAVWINMMAGSKRQGASTISQQTARTLFLSSEKTYIRKLKEALLTYKMEQNLSKEEILYLYLNQIYLGQGAYGVAAAAETYFRKPLQKLSLAEAAMLAGLPTSPSRLNPVIAPQRAKDRQLYVLKRMVEEGYVTDDEAKKAGQEVLKVQAKKIYKEAGPYFVETVRQLLVKELGEEKVLEDGLKIYTSLDINAQKEARESVHAGLRSIDKRRGYRGPKAMVDLKDEGAVQKILADSSAWLIRDKNTVIEILPDGTSVAFPTFQEHKKNSKDGTNIPPYVNIGEIVDGVVTRVDDALGLVFVRFTESHGIIPLADMAWARKFNPDLAGGEHLNIKKPSQALAPGNVIDVRVVAPTYASSKKGKTPAQAYKDYAHLALEQEPEVQGALLSFDSETKDITAMVGGLDYYKFRFNRAYQAIRQTGSAFKPIIYAAGLENDMTVATTVMDAPIVYGGKPIESGEAAGKNDDKKSTDKKSAAAMEEETQEVWKPENYDGKYLGDILMRTALKRSRNTPTIRILQKATVPYTAEYARRLGIFSPLNMDMSLALGTSGVSVYEMNKAMAVFANGGKRFVPIIVREVKDRNGEVILKNLSLDQKFHEKLEALETEFAQKRDEYKKSLETFNREMASRQMPTDEDDVKKPKPPVNGFFFENNDQLISPTTAYLVTNMLQGVAMEPDGTGGRAAALSRPVAGKTGTTNGYYDAWFLGYTANVISTVWVGLDTEKTLGMGETGGDAALPIWLPYMQAVHKDVPVKSFDIPEDIVFVTVDKDTGKASPTGIRLPFRRGTEPGLAPRTFEEKQVEEKNFLRESF